MVDKILLDVVPTRRQRLREATAEEIKAVARDLMTREGTSSLNLRAIARQMGVTPSALYRYFPSRDAILTALIVDAYDAVGEAVESAVRQAPHDLSCTAILGAVHTFRRWALDHPHEFGLIYGSPVPGYEAPEEPTKAAAMRTSVALLDLFRRGVEQNLITIPDDQTVPAALRPTMHQIADMKGHEGLSVAGATVALQFWIVLLGCLNAEVFGHLPPGLVEHSALFFDHTMRGALAAMGVDRSAIDASAPQITLQDLAD